MSGKNVLQASYEDVHADLDISSLAAGVYFLRVLTDKGSAVKKFVKVQE